VPGVVYRRAQQGGASMEDSLSSLVLDASWSQASKSLDGAIRRAEIGVAPASCRAQLHLNRGVCNQRLGLHRKALKVRAIWLGVHSVLRLVGFQGFLAAAGL